MEKIIKNTKLPWAAEHMKNDIIIIKLKSPLKFNDNVQPACLPDVASFVKAQASKQMAVLSGWGGLKDQGETPNLLQFLPLPLFPDGKCGGMYDGALAIACSVLDTQLGVRIHAKEILEDLWSWPRVQVTIPLSLLELSVMVWASAVRKEHQQSTPESPSTWIGLRQTWAKIQAFIYIHSCCVEIKP